MAVSRMPAAVAMSSATATGASPWKERNRTVVVSVFWAMNTTSSTSSNPSPTVPTHTPLVREPRSGLSGVRLFSGSGVVGWSGVSGCSLAVLTPSI